MSNITNEDIQKALLSSGLTALSVADGRLMLLEFMVKAGAGIFNSYTQKQYMKHFAVLKSDNTPNKRGRAFLYEMIAPKENDRAQCFDLMLKFR